MVGRVSYLGRVKQDNKDTHVLHTIPNPNYTLPKPYPFIITYPIHYPTFDTQTGRVLPCASINTTLPWIPTYPYSSIVIPYPSTYPTLPTIGKKYPSLHWVSTPPHVTSVYIPVPTSQYLLLHTPTLYFPTLYYCQGLIKYNIIKYKAKTIYQIRPKLPRTKTTRAEMNQGWNEQPEYAVAVVEQEHTCSCPFDYIALNIVRVRIFCTSNIFIIIMFPYTGTVTGTELGVEFYTP